jgi:hypothetical protein
LAACVGLQQPVGGKLSRSVEAILFYKKSDRMLAIDENKVLQSCLP